LDFSFQLLIYLLTFTNLSIFGSDVNVDSRERIIKSLNHEEPDRIPIDIGSPVTSFHKEAYENLRRYLGLKINQVKIIDHVQQTAEAEEDILRRFHSDTRHVFIEPAKPLKKIDDFIYEDEWGIRTSKPISSHYYDMIKFPLANANLNDLDHYNWPDPRDPERFKGLK